MLKENARNVCAFFLSWGLLPLGILEAQTPSPTGTPTYGCVGYRCEREACSIELRNVYVSPSPIESGKPATLSGDLVTTGAGCGRQYTVSFNARSTTVTTSGGMGRFQFRNFGTSTPERNAGGTLCAEVTAVEDISFLSRIVGHREAAVDTLYLEFPIYACNDMSICQSAKCANQRPPEDRPDLSCAIYTNSGEFSGVYGTIVPASTCQAMWNGDCSKGYRPGACGFDYCSAEANAAAGTIDGWIDSGPEFLQILLPMALGSGGYGSMNACEKACDQVVQGLSGKPGNWNEIFFRLSGGASYDTDAACKSLCKQTMNLCRNMKCFVLNRLIERCPTIGTTFGKQCTEAALAEYSREGCGSRTMHN